MRLNDLHPYLCKANCPKLIGISFIVISYANFEKKRNGRKTLLKVEDTKNASGESKCLKLARAKSKI